MRWPLSLNEFAALTRAAPGEIESYRRVGLLDLDQDGLFERLDVLRLQLVLREVKAGRPVEEIGEALHDDPIALGVFSAHADSSAEKVASGLAVDPEVLQPFLSVFGLTTDGRMDEEELEVFRLAKGMADAGIPWDVMLEGARVYADTLGRLAEASVRMTHRSLCEGWRRTGMDDEQIAQNLAGALGIIAPSAEAIVDHLLRRYMREALIDHALEHLRPIEVDAPPGTTQGSIAFIDLSLFSTLAEIEGDEEAVRIIDRFDQCVRESLVRHDGRLVKQIGDEFMLIFREPADAVRLAIEVHSAMDNTERFVSLRTGIHHGPLLYRLGDYYGKAVNIAARIASMAMPNAILATEPVAKAALDARIEMEEIGVRSLRGMDEPIPLYRVA